MFPNCGSGCRQTTRIRIFPQSEILPDLAETRLQTYETFPGHPTRKVTTLVVAFSGENTRSTALVNRPVTKSANDDRLSTSANSCGILSSVLVVSASVPESRSSLPFPLCRPLHILIRWPTNGVGDSNPVWLLNHVRHPPPGWIRRHSPYPHVTITLALVPFLPLDVRIAAGDATTCVRT